MDKKEIKHYAAFGLTAIIVCYIIQHFALVEKAVGIALGALTPLILGAIIAYIFNIILSWFEKHYFPKTKTGFIQFSRRPVCLVISFLIAIGVVVLILNIVIPELINAVKLISAKIPPLVVTGKEYILHKLREYPEIQAQATELFNEFDTSQIDWASITGKVTGVLKSGLLGIISSAVGFLGALTGTVTNIVLAVIFAIYLLLRKDKLLCDIGRFQKVYCSEKTNERINRVFATANTTFQSFFIGQFVEAIILGSLCFIGMTILRLPYAGMSGTLVGVTALIPIVGAFLGAGISAFIIATENPMQALIFIIFLIILQQLEGNIIYPKVVGNSIGLPGIWVLAAVTVGGGLFGILGMMVGVPLAATVYKLVFDSLENKEAEKGIINVSTDKKTDTPKVTKKNKKEKRIRNSGSAHNKNKQNKKH